MTKIPCCHFQISAAAIFLVFYWYFAKNGQDVDNNLITSGKKGVFYQASVYLFIYLLVLSNFT